MVIKNKNIVQPQKKRSHKKKKEKSCRPDFNNHPPGLTACRHIAAQFPAQAPPRTQVQIQKGSRYGANGVTRSGARTGLLFVTQSPVVLLARRYRPPPGTLPGIVAHPAQVLSREKLQKGGQGLGRYLPTGKIQYNATDGLRGKGGARGCLSVPSRCPLFW